MKKYVSIANIFASPKKMSLFGVIFLYLMYTIIFFEYMYAVFMYTRLLMKAYFLRAGSILTPLYYIPYS